MTFFLIGLLVLGVGCGIGYLMDYSDTKAYDRYKVRYIRSECLESPHCPQVFKDQYAMSLKSTASKDLVGVLNGLS